MRSFSTLFLMLALVLPMTLVSCMTYTYADAREAIAPVPSMPPEQMAETRLAALRAEEPEQQATIPARLPLTLLRVALVPLPCDAEEQQLRLILTESARRDFDIIGFTGDASSVAFVKEHARMPSFSFGEDGIVLTNLEILATGSMHATLSAGEYRTLDVSLVNLQDSVVFPRLRETKDTSRWEHIIAQDHQQRVARIEGLLEPGHAAHLVLASLGEPSAEDWHETAPNHAYRVAIDWPMGELFEEAGYLDSWRSTTFSAITDPGWTWEFTGSEDEQYAERVDFLFARGLVPIETETVPIGPWQEHALPSELRSAVTGTFLLP